MVERNIAVFFFEFSFLIILNSVWHSSFILLKFIMKLAIFLTYLMGEKRNAGGDDNNKIKWRTTAFGGFFYLTNTVNFDFSRL